MNRYISTKDALDTLSALAPRAWCKKLLTCLMFEGSLTPYASGGRLIGRVPLPILLDDDNIAPKDGGKFWAAVSDKYGPGGPSEAEGKSTNRGILLRITGAAWSPDNVGFGNHAVGFGYFHYADSLDWEAGRLTIESLFPDECWRELFLEDDAMFHSGSYLAQPRFSWLEFEVELTDLCFERTAIEMLTGFEQPNNPVSHRRLGRPKKWDWEGAMAHVAAEANRNPDGLPVGYGAQTKVEQLILNWFMTRSGETPAESEVRLRATKVLAAIEEGRKA